MTELAIVAGGEGTRLRDVSVSRPKCLTPIGGLPVLGHLLNLAVQSGISRVAVLIGRGASQVEEYLSGAMCDGLDVRTFRERSPLGTAGGFRQNSELWGETLIVIYGDLLCNVDLERMLAFHRRNEADLTLFAHATDHTYDSDLLDVDDTSRVIELLRKPHPPNELRGNIVNGAIYIVEDCVRDLIPEAPSDWAQDVFPRVIESGLRVFAYRSSEYLKDIGTPARLQQAERDWGAGIVKNGSYHTARPAIIIDCVGMARADANQMLSGFASTIRRINESRFLLVLVVQGPFSREKFFASTLAQTGVYSDVIYSTTEGQTSLAKKVMQIIEEQNLAVGESAWVTLGETRSANVLCDTQQKLSFEQQDIIGPLLT